MSSNIEELLERAEASLAQADALCHQARLRYDKLTVALRVARDQYEDVQARPRAFAASTLRDIAERKSEAAITALKNAEAGLRAAELEFAAATKEHSDILSRLNAQDVAAAEDERRKQAKNEGGWRWSQWRDPQAWGQWSDTDPVKKEVRSHGTEEACRSAGDDRQCEGQTRTEWWKQQKQSTEEARTLWEDSQRQKLDEQARKEREAHQEAAEHARGEECQRQKKAAAQARRQREAAEQAQKEREDPQSKERDAEEEAWRMWEAWEQSQRQHDADEQAQEARKAQHEQEAAAEKARKARDDARRQRDFKPAYKTYAPPPPIETWAEKASRWHQACEKIFADKGAMRSFPQPPAEWCKNPGCEASARGRTLHACPCNIRRLFAGRPKSTLKMDRLQYHPDRFSAVPDGVRSTVQQAAKEVFVVVDSMYRG